MKTISDYTIYCTETQTKKALKLGAPVLAQPDVLGNRTWLKVTAEQMIGWLEENDIQIDFERAWDGDTNATVWKHTDKKFIKTIYRSSRKEATLASIDVALEYLITNNLIK